MLHPSKLGPYQSKTQQDTATKSPWELSWGPYGEFKIYDFQLMLSLKRMAGGDRFNSTFEILMTYIDN